MIRGQPVIIVAVSTPHTPTVVQVLIVMANSSVQVTVHKITKIPCSDTLADHFQFLTVQSKNFTCGKIE